MSRALRQAYVVDGRVFEAELHLADDRLRGSVAVGEESLDLDVSARRLGTGRVRIELADRTVRATVYRNGDTAWVCIDGRTYELAIEDPGTAGAQHAGEEDVAVSPMTGVLVKVSVGVGDRAAAGDELFVVEAMKMEYVVRAPRDVTVAEVRHEAGESIDHGRVVIAFAEDDA